MDIGIFVDIEVVRGDRDVGTSESGFWKSKRWWIMVFMKALLE